MSDVRQIRRREDLASQQKSLLLAEPLSQLETRSSRFRTTTLKAAGFADPESVRLDMRYIALAMLDRVMEESAFNPGAHPEMLRETGIEELKRMMPGISDEGADEISRRILDHIRNASGGYEFFKRDYYDSVDGALKTHFFRYLVVEADPDDAHASWIKLHEDGKKLLFGMLDMPENILEEAERFMLQRAIERNLYSDAQMAANRARSRSLSYKGKVEDHLRRVRRDWHQVNWAEETLPMLTEAIKHLRSRVLEEQEILTRLSEKMSELQDKESRKSIQALKTTIEGCSEVHSNLLMTVQKANREFRDITFRSFQDRRGITHCRDPEEEILMPLLMAPIGEVARHSDTLLTAFSGTHVDPVLSIPDLFEDMIAPYEAAPVIQETEEEGAFVVHTEPDPMFSEQTLEHLASWTEARVSAANGIRLSDLLKEAVEEGMDIHALRGIVLLSLMPFGESTGQEAAEDEAGILFEGRWSQGSMYGDDIIFKHPTHEAVTHHEQ